MTFQPSRTPKVPVSRLARIRRAVYRGGEAVLLVLAALAAITATVVGTLAVIIFAVALRALPYVIVLLVAAGLYVLLFR